MAEARSMPRRVLRFVRDWWRRTSEIQRQVNAVKAEARGDADAARRAGLPVQGGPPL